MSRPPPLSPTLWSPMKRRPMSIPPVSSGTSEPHGAGDPFGTARLRESTLRAWQDSPTRLLEDTNVEQDLRVGAYRDRLFVELALNAADAAMAAGQPGRIRESLVCLLFTSPSPRD